MTKRYEASTGSRIAMVAITIPPFALLLFVGFDLATTHSLVGGLFLVVFSMLIGIGMLFPITVRIDVRDDAIIRTWLFGKTVVPIQDITRLTGGGVPRARFLTIEYGKPRRFITISRDVAPKDAFQEMQTAILEARGLGGETRPPIVASYVDIDAMLERKRERADPG